MKSRKPLLPTLAAGAFLFAGTLIAQNAPPPPQPPSTGQDAVPAPPPPPTGQDMPPAPATSAPPPVRRVPPMPRVPDAQSTPPAPPAEPTPATASSSAQAAASQASQGQVVVRSVPAPAPTIGPAPSFEQLSGGKKSISEEQAVAYPPLANDFIHADTNRNGSISKTEYANWTKQL